MFLSKYRAAAIQFEPKLGDLAGNIERLIQLTEKAAKRGNKLIVLPEMATIGYCFYDRVEIAPYLEPIPGPTTDRFSELTKNYECYIVVGLGEVDNETGIFYNSAALIRPDGRVEKMRKVHPYVADTKWAKDGDLGFPVWETDIGKIAAIICADADYFESSRVAAIAGADVICMPTNWLAERAPAGYWITRAYENGVYLIAADRYGEERGVQFSGGSCVVGPDGTLLAVLDTGDGIVESEIDLGRKHERRLERGLHGGRMAERRPEHYGDLVLNPLYSGMRYSRDLYDYQPLPDGEQCEISVIQAEEPSKGLFEDLIDQVAKDERDAPLRLIVLPELTLIRDVGDASEYSETLPGPTTKWASNLAKKYDLNIVLGVPEREGNMVFNTVILVGPDGLVGNYRKVHLGPLDRPWATPGDQPFSTLDLSFGRVGLLIGHDLLFPESARCLAILGADVICAPSAMSGPLPTDLPPSDVPLAKEIVDVPLEGYWHLWRWRASENNSYLAFANRSDGEIMGWSGIFGPNTYEFPFIERYAPGKGNHVLRLQVDTRDYIASEKPNLVRHKDTIRMRKPHFYDQLVVPR